MWYLLLLVLVAAIGYWYFKIFKRYDIKRRDSPYLTRWVLWGDRYARGCKLFLHKFHRSDSDEALHDHPWNYWSLIVWGGYWEHTCYSVKWYGVGSLLRRRAEHAHRVEIPMNESCYTLFWTSRRERTWFFHCPQGLVHYKGFVDREEEGKKGCDE